jgi:hypothetical protein
MDWFEQLTGFKEEDYATTQSRLAVDERRLRSLANGKSFAVGEFELVTLQCLRERSALADGPSGSVKVKLVTGDVRELHRRSEYSGALFQVASQFNMLEMVSPTVTPEHGVTRYQNDHTQGPACAIAAGAATIYRNYFVPIGQARGQTASRQLDGLAELGQALAGDLNRPVSWLWRMENGYALCSRESLQAIGRHLQRRSPEQLNSLRSKLCIGLHRDVEVTDHLKAHGGPIVSQAFCSALPVAYSGVGETLWAPFARLILEAAYEATLWAAVINARRHVSNTVLLTSLGGGAFGNDERWILSAMVRAITLVSGYDLDVRVVSHGRPSTAMARIVDQFG